MRLATNEVMGFLSQSRISQKNIARLEQLADIEDSEFQRLRLYILEIARLHPGKKRRWINLSRIAPHLFEALVESEFFDEWIDEAYSSTRYPFSLDDPDQGDLLGSESLVVLNRYLQELAQEASESELEYNTSLEPD
ncbi:MAG: hypothetical protein MUD03_05525 [Pirellula sp.]|jgi:hypothetical protein|nr:hypothetical protein [Pirellula sp.]